MSNSKAKKKLSHCLILTYPAIGHINPMLQFSKRLEHKGVKATLVITKSILKTIDISGISVAIETISDGYDDGGIRAAESTGAYLDRFKLVGSDNLASLIERLSGYDRPVDCLVCEAFLPWGIDVAKRFGLMGALFFTQSCAVDAIYYHANKGLLKLPVSEPVSSIPEIPSLAPSEFPSFLHDPESDQAFMRLLVDQFSLVDKSDWVLCNSYYELEEEVASWMMKTVPFRTIGPLLPSIYLDKRIEGDNQYGLTLTNPNFEACMNWLNSHSKRTVAYVSFGSYVPIEAEQIEEVAFGLIKSGSHFLWAVRESEASKLPKGFVENIAEKGLVVSWCPQLEVLANDAVGCFVTHCGWNSTLEALSFGVPMVAIPQWSDQSTNTKYVVDVWKVGVKAEKDEKGIVRQQVLEKCLREIMGERGEEMRVHAFNWSELAKRVVDHGGTSDKYIDEFIGN